MNQQTPLPEKIDPEILNSEIEFAIKTILKADLEKSIIDKVVYGTPGNDG